ncbi:MAG: cation-transporting P-type ATPase [Clostridium sp.]
MYEGKTIDETLKKLSADGERGLREEDVKERQKHYGRNELEEKKQKTLLKRFAGQLCDSLISCCLQRPGFPCFWGSTATQ